MPGQAFIAVVESGDGRGAALRLPFDAKAVFGRARSPVWVSIQGGEPFGTTIAIYGGVGWIGLRKAQLAELGVEVGDAVAVTVEPDDSPREVDIPAELAATLHSSHDAELAYQALSFTHRKEYARWVAEAKRPETRKARAAKAIEMLNDGVRTPG